jgi:hypothetical protein
MATLVALRPRGELMIRGQRAVVRLSTNLGLLLGGSMLGY